jgi:hypothetical protein
VTPQQFATLRKQFHPIIQLQPCQRDAALECIRESCPELERELRDLLSHDQSPLDVAGAFTALRRQFAHPNRSSKTFIE